MRRAISVFLILVFAGYSIRCAGQRYELSREGTTITITGTSTLHDWKMDVNSCNSGFQINMSGFSGSIDNIKFSCKVSNIKSESSLMDKKAYSALKAEQFPEIKFEGISMSDLKFEERKFTGILKGLLSVAGRTETVTVPFDGYFSSNNKISIVAKADLSMSSFNITPPTAILGTLKTGDRISVLFSLQYTQMVQ